MASDGIWEHLHPQTIPKTALNQIKNQKTDDQEAENFADSLLLKAIMGWKKVTFFFKNLLESCLYG